MFVRRSVLACIMAPLFWVAAMGEPTVLVDSRKADWRGLIDAGKASGDWVKMNHNDRRWSHAKALRGAPSGSASVSVWRHRFNVEDVAAVGRLQLRMRYRDGVVVYLNGVEWVRANMPPGFIDLNTWAAARRANSEVEEFEVWEAERSRLQEGGNVIALALHRAEDGQEPASCVLSLSGEPLKRDQSSSPSKEDREDNLDREGRELDLTDIEAVAGAYPEDWKITAFSLEEQALEYYGDRNWVSAASYYAQSQLAYVYAFRGASLDGNLKGYLLRETELAREFLDLLSPDDDHRDVFPLLDRLYKEDSKRFERYARLAMAIALVYDQRPPRRWPHNQASSSALPRELPDPLEAFDFWATSDQKGKTLHRLDDLMIEELKYVVDVVAPFEELRWSQDTLKLRKLSAVEKLYWSIRYDDERYQNNQTKWPDEDYRLETILKRGGICSDQAYYMTQIAKAHGVPCIAVTGLVEDGLHAWAGFMEAPGHWNFQAGRNPESNYVTGRIYDPQTWRRPLDYELAFLKERLSRLPRYRLSRLHSGFAALAMRQGDSALALAAATDALREDGRNLQAWERLLDLTEDRGGAAANSELKVLCRNGAKAFRDYPDLEASFQRRLAGLLEERGEDEAAHRVRREIIRKNRRERPDLALAEAARELQVAMEEAPLEEQISFYKRQVSRFRQAGLITGHRMVEPFVRHLLRLGETDLASRAIDYARKRLEVRIPEQLERMLASLEGRFPPS